MCLLTFEKPHTEDHDVISYKYVTEVGKNGWAGPFTPIKSIYPFGVLITAEKNIDGTLRRISNLEPCCPYDTKHDCPESIHEGFHSSIFCQRFDWKICVIPAGTELCHGTYGDIASVKIVVFKNKLQFFFKYKLKKMLNKSFKMEEML